MLSKEPIPTTQSTDNDTSTPIATNKTEPEIIAEPTAESSETKQIRHGILGLLRFILWFLVFLFLPGIICMFIGGYNSINYILGLILTISLFLIVTGTKKSPQ